MLQKDCFVIKKKKIHCHKASVSLALASRAGAKIQDGVVGFLSKIVKSPLEKMPTQETPTR